jgi:3',5'-cyclic AMP phosphodiesterase CpdA
MRLKRGFKLVLLVLLSLSLSLVIYLQDYDLAAYSRALPEASSKSDLAFSVLSDIHSNSSKLEEALIDLYKINPHKDAVILNGDTVDQGLVSHYEDIKKTLNKSKRLLPEIVIRNIGNHEFFDYDNGTLAPEQVQTYLDRYFEFSGEKKVYSDRWIKGYHFITLGTESGNTKELGAVKALISKEQLKWFEEKLAENYVAGRPIFVFLHQHLSTAMRGWVGTDQAKELDEILSKYKEAIVFTSHTHVSFETNNVFTDKPYTIVHTGGINYQLSPDGKGGRAREDGSQGIYVEVSGSAVTVKGREFIKKQWMFEKTIIK